MTKVERRVNEKDKWSKLCYSSEEIKGNKFFGRKINKKEKEKMEYKKSKNKRKPISFRKVGQGRRNDGKEKLKDKY